MTPKTRLAMIGVGDMARHHIGQILQQSDTTEIVAFCEPSAEQAARSAALFEKAGLNPPPNEPDLTRLLAKVPLDAAFIITPHVFHHDQTVACLEAGVDVLLEKPMVMNAAEADSLIASHQPHRSPAGRGVSWQPVAPDPHRRLDAPLRRAWPAAEHQRDGLAGLGTQYGGNVAPGAGDCRRRLPVRHRRAHAQHRGRSGRGRISLR